MPYKNLFLLSFLVLWYGGVQVRGQISNIAGYLVDQRANWVAIVTDPDLIQLFVDEMFLAETAITRIEVFDLDNNGVFGQGDIFKTYPDEQIYHLDDPSERLLSVIINWQFQPNFSVIQENSDNLPETLEARPSRKAGNAIIASLLRGLNRNYEDLPVKIWVERDSATFRFEMWSYHEDKLVYHPPPPVVTMPDTVTTYDMLHVFRTDTLVIADTTFYDFLYIYKTVSDTVFLPEK